MTLRLLMAALLAVALGACSSLYRRVQPQWVEADLPAGSQKVLFEVAHLSLDKAGFDVGVGADPAGHKLSSNWYVSESPFRGKGYRERATLEYSEAETDGEFHVRVRIEREVNNSPRPLSAEHREWEQDQDNVARANHVLQYMRIYLGADEFEVGAPRRDFRE